MTHCVVFFNFLGFVQIFANAFPVHYSPPTGFHFEVNDDYVRIQVLTSYLLVKPVHCKCHATYFGKERGSLCVTIHNFRMIPFYLITMFNSESRTLLLLLLHK